MSEFIPYLERTLALDTNTHWFCPRTSQDDLGLYFDEDVRSGNHEESEDARAERKRRIEEAEKRRDEALEGFKILAYDGDDAKPYQDQILGSLKVQLGRCDICIREFHRARALLSASLEAVYEVDEVAAFMEKFDNINTSRITDGLDLLGEMLTDLPPKERSIMAVGDAGMYALFEALQCVPFLSNEEMVARIFDKPFRLVQTNKKVRLPSLVPGMAAFSFSRDKDRLAWATRNLSSIKRAMYDEEFEYSVKPFWTRAMRRVNIASLELEFLPLFWSSTKLILSKLTKPQISQHVRSMESNLYTMSLEHFQVDAPHFSDLVACYEILLKLSAIDFWDAMGSVNAQSIIETICRAPALEHLLSITEETDPLILKQKLSWAQTFITHIKPANLVPPLRTLLGQMLHRFQATKYSRHAKKETWIVGLSCLHLALETITTNVEGGPVYSHLTEMIAADHMKVILEELEGVEKKSEVSLDEGENFGLQIIEKIVALNVKGLARDQRVIFKTRELDHQVDSYGVDIWTQCMRQVKGGYPVLASALFAGLQSLLALEVIPPAQIKLSPKAGKQWNDTLAKYNACIATDLLGRLEGFSHDHLMDLYQEPSAAQGLITLLFNGDEVIHQGALGVLKSLTGEDVRRDCLMHVVKAFFGITLSSIAHSIKALSDAHIFTPCQIMLKVCTDVYNCLCDSQDGVLRSTVLESDHDRRALEQLWHSTWICLETIFEKTEIWSSQGFDKTQMQDFCRETMDFAEYVFDQYAIFANVIKPTDSEGKNGMDVSKELLQLPSRVFRSITKWLRLRDEYLITKSVSLTRKILGRLKQADIRISDDAAQYLEDIVTSGEHHAKVRTKLSMNQKAELQRALEQHLGEPLNEVIDLAAAPERKKQSSLQDWAKSGRYSGSSTPRSTTPAASRPEKHISVVSSTAAAQQKRIAERKALEQKLKSQKLVKQQQQSNDFLLKRQQAKAAYEQNKQAALAKEGGGGSGIAGIGNLGQEHSVKGQTVMMSSEEESDDDDDDDMDDELFGSTNKPKERKKIERLGLVPEGAVGPRPEQKRGPTRIQRATRSLKDMRARLAPDLGPLHRVILAWDFFHEGDYPPNANADQFSEVPDKFTDPITYQQTFEPLLLLEAWQGMVKAREENVQKPFEIKIGNRTNVDSFIELSSIIGHAENRDIQLQEGDIILFSKSPKPGVDAASPHCLARVYRMKRQKAHLEVIYQTMPSGQLSSQLTPQTLIHGLKVQSITPLEREYGALKALQYYDLCNQIVRAKPSARIAVSDRQISALQDVYNVNRAQSEAINAALENDGFSLIQGPPGSGKTKTIVAIVGGLLTTTLNSVRSATKINVPKANGQHGAPADAPSRKLLVCAPSNAAVDELVMRLKDGVKSKNGAEHAINVVRIGRSDAINTQVKDVTIDELVAAKLGNTNNNEAKLREANTALFKEHGAVSAQLKDLYDQRNNGDLKGTELAELESTLSNLRRRKAELSTRIDSAKDRERNAGREAEMSRKRAQQAVLDEAHVICATLSGSGHDMFQGLNIEFETVIIDEAAQCVEMSSLIPLKYGCIKCIMVGDPKQLPPTVFSKEAAKFQYEQSLFVRMQNNHANEVHLLDTQYRMHPNISAFPSESFYDGLLKDGPNMARLRERPWHASALLSPYQFFDVKGQHQSAPKGHSLINLAEIDVALALYQRLITDFRDYDFSGRIGIITPYKSQLRALKERFSREMGESILDSVEFNTTDAFQGRESEIIIFSCVRASPAGGIGFLQDIRRMNVGLTRAKCSMWVLGNSESLVRGRYWKKLVDDAQARECYTTGDIRAMLKKPSDTFPAKKSVTHTNGKMSHSTGADGKSKKGGAPGPIKAEPHAAVKKEDVQVKSEPDDDRMEGVRYRFEDRVKKTIKDEDKMDSTGDVGPLTTKSEDVPSDVEMGDASASESKSVKAESHYSNNSSRAATPHTETEKRPKDEHARKPKSTAPLPAPQPSLIRKKRPAASPFMPPKRPRPQ